MATVIIEANNPQAKQLIEYIKTLPFVTVVEEEKETLAEAAAESNDEINQQTIEHLNSAYEEFEEEPHRVEEGHDSTSYISHEKENMTLKDSSLTKTLIVQIKDSGDIRSITNELRRIDGVGKVSIIEGSMPRMNIEEFNAEIDRALADFREGRTISHEEFGKKIEGWS